MDKYEIYIGKIIFESDENESIWFGYYNISPIDKSGTRMLAHKAKFEGRMFSAADVAEVGWYDLNSKEWHHIGETSAVNWQQGAMLQWRPEYENEIIYNCMVDGTYGSKIVNIDNGKEKTLHYPIYALSPDGKKSLTLNFERLYWTRAYHYEVIKNEKWNVNVPKEDGIFELDLDLDKTRLVLPLEKIIETNYEDCFNNASHWLEHILINKEGTRIAFYHRFSVENGFLTRLFTAGLDGTDIYCYKEWKDIGWSHLGWKTNDTFVAFGYERVKSARVYENITEKTGAVGRFIKQVYRTLIYPCLPRKVHHAIALNSCYEEYRDKEGKIRRYQHNIMYNDGHPSFTREGRYMLADTYALGDGYRYLYIYDTLKNEIFIIGRFYSPYNNCGYRSDLHPRFSPDEKYVIIDTAHSGHHGMMVIELDWRKLGKVV